MQKRRQFTLQAVLDNRLQVEETARRAVAELLRMDAAHAGAMKSCEQAALEHMRLLHGGGPLSIAQARACEFHLAALRDCSSRLLAESRDVRAALDRARHHAIEAARDRRAIETLRDRYLAVCAAAHRRVEEEDIAEVDSFRKGNAG